MIDVPAGNIARFMPNYRVFHKRCDFSRAEAGSERPHLGSPHLPVACASALEKSQRGGIYLGASPIA